jgi:hypothetical protein
MTQSELDRLAVLCGMKNGYYERKDGVWADATKWRPEESFDDCKPIYDEIERRGLWEEFRDSLQNICTMHTSITDVIEYYYGQVQPADIVAAFMKTVEDKP